MIQQLQALIARRAAAPLPLESLRERFGERSTLRRPADVLDAAQALCRLALARPSAPVTTVAEAGADALVRFIATLPPAIEAEVRAMDGFADPVQRASDEPRCDLWVGLACTVQDVWAHLLGPEADEDDAVLHEVLRHRPARVLDYGCGAGHFLHALAVRGVAVDGVELDRVKRAFIEHRIASAGLSDRVQLAPRDGGYDTALALNVLDHLDEPADAVAFIAARLAPGAVLCTLAAFPDDGWHQCDPEVVDRCAAALWRDFVPLAPSREPVPWLEAFRRAPAVRPGARPCLHPAARVHAGRQADERVLAVPSALARPCALDADTARLCGAFDGLATLQEIAGREGVAEDDLLGLCLHLEQQRLLFWTRDAAAPVRADAASVCEPMGA